MPNTREKLIELLNDICVTVDVSNMIADHLIANGVTVQKWIPVSERLPENAKKVLALVKRLTGDGYYTMLLRYNHKKRGFFDYDSEWGDRRINDVTHWMPLPELPKGE